MMEGVYQWIRNLAGYLMFLTVLEQVLPGKKYGKYIQLFAGMVLIILVLQPVTDGARLSEQIASAYRELEFQYEAEDLRVDILGVEEKQLRHLIAQYESAVAMDVRQMSEDMGFAVQTCDVSICMEESDECFGTVTAIAMEVRQRETDGGRGAVGRLQRKLASYYHLGESYVEIRVSERER